VIVTAGFNYFYLTGALGVAFALIISFVGLTRPSKFPGKSMPVLMVLSVVLFLLGIVGAAAGAKFKGGERHGPPEGTPVAGHKGG
jgi:hypothetical protein